MSRSLPMHELTPGRQWLPVLSDSSPSSPLWTADMLELASRWLPREYEISHDEQLIDGADLGLTMSWPDRSIVAVRPEQSLDNNEVVAIEYASSLCLQRAMRCHWARGMFQRTKRFREDKSKVNWERKLRLLIVELQEMDDEEVGGAVSDVLGQVQELPAEQQAEIKLFLLESSCPFACYLRERSSRAIQAAFRGHRARRRLSAVAVETTSGGKEQEGNEVVEYEESVVGTSQSVEGEGREEEAVIGALLDELVESAILSHTAAQVPTVSVGGDENYRPGRILREEKDLIADGGLQIFLDCDLEAMGIEDTESMRVRILKAAADADRRWTDLVQEGAPRSEIQGAESVAKMLRGRAEEFSVQISEKRRLREEMEEVRRAGEDGFLEALDVSGENVQTDQEVAERGDRGAANVEKKGGREERGEEQDVGGSDDQHLMYESTDCIVGKDAEEGDGREVHERSEENNRKGALREKNNLTSKTTWFQVDDDLLQTQTIEETTKQDEGSVKSSTAVSGSLRRSLNRTSASGMSILSKRSAANKLNKLLTERKELAKKSLKLDLSGAKMNEIPPSIFNDVRIRNIRILWLDHNLISNVPDAIGDFCFLTQIRLNNNVLLSLPPRIGDLEMLQILMLQSNSISTIPPEIERLQSLTHLSLQDNPLSALPVELSRLRRMKKLELSPDHLSFPPRCISVLGTRKIVEFLRRADVAWSSQVLDLSGLDLEELPVDIVGLFPRLQELYINMNRIDSIPLEFHLLTTLVEIRLDSDIIRSPSMEIWSFGIQTTLEFMKRVSSCAETCELSLKKWNLTAMPGEVFLTQHASLLTKLNVSENNFKVIPDEISSLSALTELYMDSNLLESLPASLFRLSELRIASFSMNRIHAIADKFHKLSSLERLSLDCNELDSIPASLCRLTCLSELSLSSNRLSSELDGLANISSLKRLYLMDNLIERLPLSFSNFTRLQEIEIEGNIVWSPPKDITSQPFPVWFDYLHQLSLARLPQQCFLSDYLYVGGILHLNKFGLSVFPPEVVSAGSDYLDLIEINLDYNLISALPRDVSKLSNLTVLSMRENRFRTLPKTLGKCYSLSEINFENNLLTFLPLDIGNLTGLKKLKLDGNNLTHPPLEIVKLGIPAMIRFLKLFAEASSNGEVAMSGCDLKSFPLAIADVEDIKIVDLSHNYIGRIPAEFLACKTIVQLDLSYNSLDEIEIEMRRMVSLTTLKVSGNKLVELPSCCLHLTNLLHLHLNMNRIASIPASIKVMTWLKLLNLSNNEIESLPLEIGKLNSLQTFIISYNRLSSLPTTVGGMTALSDLSISSNQIVRLPPILGVMTSLTEVNIQENLFDEHPVEVVQNALVMQKQTKQWHNGISAANPLAIWLSRLRTARVTKEFDASNFRLEVIPAEILLSTNLHIVQLKLEFNKLHAVPAEIARLSTLTFLNLSHNSLRDLPRSIGTLSNLTVLYLNDNKLSRLPIEIGHLCPTILARLSISNNRLETPPPELRSASTKHILRYYLTSQVATISGALDWSWSNVIRSMRAICNEVVRWQELVEVNLDGNDLNVIEVDICLGMPQLEILQLRRNRITTIPSDLSLHSRLRKLAISQNRIKVLPRSLARMRNLRTLEIRGLPLISPCQEITRYSTENILAYLACMVEAEEEKVCVLSDFNLSEIPSEVFSLTSLRCLELNRMELSVIPEAITVLSDLTSLSFSQNHIQELPIFLSTLTNLTELELIRNKVTVLYPELHALTNLITLNVFSNPINSPPFEIIKTILPKRGESSSKVGFPGQGQLSKQTPSPHVVLSFLRALLVARSSLSLSLSNFELIQWPRESYDLPELRQICMDENLLRAIPDGIANLSRLTSISLVGNHIKVISDMLSEVTGLTFLNLERNRLETMPSFMASFPRLRTVSFANNLLTVFDPSLFQCSHIESLSIRGNKMREIPPEIASLYQLSDLDYRDNPIIFPPEDILSQGLAVMMKFYVNIMSCAPACSFRDMEQDARGDKLCLDSFALARLPLIVFRGLPRPGEDWSEQRVRRDRWAYGMTQLASLSIQGNMLEELPDGISRIARLSSLLCSLNEIRVLPESLGTLTSLRMLDLHGNKLTELPPGISNLSSLTVLDVSQNRLQQLPAGLGYLPDLKSLNAHENLIFSLPIDLCKSDSIKDLTVHNNPVRMPPPEIVGRGLRAIVDFLSRLFRCQTSNTLDLRALDLESIDYEILPIPNLERLLIANNRMKMLTGNAAGGNRTESSAAVLSDESSDRKPEAPGNVKKSSKGRREEEAEGNAQLVSLKYLNADHNRLDCFPHSITDLTSLTEISAVHNQIASLPSDLHRLSSLTRLNLVGNPITRLPLEVGLMTNLLKLDMDLHNLTAPPPEVSMAGFPRIQKYLDVLLRGRESRSVGLMGFDLLHVPGEVVTLTSLTRLVISKNSIAELPVDLQCMSGLRELWASYNKIQRLPRELCEHLTRLDSLRLDSNELTIVPIQIERLTSLTELQLQGNNVTILPLEMGSLYLLETLTLDVQEMVSPNPEICERKASLVVRYLHAIYQGRQTRVVDLRSLGLKSFPVEIYSIPSITSLYLDDNDITSLPPSIERLTDLTELSLKNLQLQSLPFVMGAMTNLERLSLPFSRFMVNPPYEVLLQGTRVTLSYLRKSYLCAKKTGYMNISNLSLQQLPEDIIRLQNLRHLQMRGNKIMFLSSAMGKMQDLEVLHMHNNGLLYLPAEFGNLQTLVELRMPFNQIKVLPADMKHCFNLKKLSLQHNLLSTVGSDILKSLTKLKSLNLSRNQIVYIPDTVGCLLELEKLRLDQNQVRTLPPEVGGCTSIALLSITCNQFSTLPDELSTCTNMTALHISANRFFQLPRCVENLKKLRQLWASNNELQGLPTFLANLPDLSELQLQGCPDLKYPPPDILLQGREVVINYLVSNMRYEMSVDTSSSETDLLILETRAKEDQEAAELAAELIVPLRELAEKALLKAEKAEVIASDLRAQVEIFDMNSIDDDASLLPEQKQVQREILANELEELRDALDKAERKAELLKGEAESARAKAEEAEEIARALKKIAEESGE